MFSFMVISKDVNKENIINAEIHFSFEFTSFQKNFISGFSFLNNMSITCGKNSFEFALYDKELTETQEKLIQNYFLKVFKGKIDGICIERDKNNYTFLNQVIEKEKIIC